MDSALEISSLRAERDKYRADARLWRDEFYRKSRAYGAEIAFLRKDQERFDWIEKENPNMFCIADDSETGFHWEINDAHIGPTLREAVDAARKNL